ncbi:hypothetical protein KAT24_01145 [Candidatus Pacearchaeota archaeon]|nr:hypothetical protein [Candidatus Pacearchaeota archaeon]
MDKKGSHVGMMLSFVIFVTFLVFLYSILQPVIKIRQDKKLILDSLIIELAKMLDSTNYTRGSIRTLNENFVVNLNQIAEEYDNDYEALKTDLKISSGNEFGFNFIDDEGVEIIAEANIPKSVDVYVKKIPVYYVEEKNVLLGFINLKIW